METPHVSIKAAITLFIALFFTFAINAQTVRYVTSTVQGTGDGSSWENASNDLQAMINASDAGDTVHVAAGTYKPQYT
ncbi:MAG: hypothetical protein LBR66_01925, partial [Candidatus Symbiothrix sp.]|nr:hypothetical protein [Candidatus Symbiothrix sp.]